MKNSAAHSQSVQPSLDASAAYEIRRARHDDIKYLSTIELAAARLLAGHAPESVLAEATSFQDFEIAQALGLLWVAMNSGRPIGFAHVKLIEAQSAHLDELDVHPEHGRRGVGRRLVRAVCDWADEHAMSQVTLSTFRDVPWNMPFYATMGFEVVLPADLSPALRGIAENESRRGLDAAKRVIMSRPLRS